MYYCTICKKEITEAEQLYSTKNYGKSLCRSHQKTTNNGLSKKEGRYKEGMIKGRIAETLIEELFLSLGYFSRNLLTLYLCLKQECSIFLFQILMLFLLKCLSLYLDQCI